MRARAVYAVAVVALAALMMIPDGFTPAILGAEGIAFVAAGALLIAYARRYLAGERHAIAVVVGAGFLLVTLVGGAARALGVLGGLSLAPIGFGALAVGFTASLGAQHRALSREVRKGRDQLVSRARELQRSYDDLRNAQQELVKREQLATIGELAAVIAHEVRNPLAIIANAVSTLKKSAASETERAELLRILDDETTRLNRIVTDLLHFARPLTVQRTKVAMNELLERALKLARKEARLRVEFQMQADDARIWGDANLLRQAFDNLIGNAVQAMGSDGTLTVRIRGGAPPTEDGLAVDIVDTGEGMDTAVRKRAKDPFFTTRPAGTGLGLAIVDRIVDAHGGHFEIDSRAGEGTRVTVLLPWGSPSDPPASKGERASRPETG